MQSQQNSAPQTAHVMWLQLPSSILTIRTEQRGQTFTEEPGEDRDVFIFMVGNGKHDLFFYLRALFLTSYHDKTAEILLLETSLY